jgi:hypothetical protein
MPPKRTSPTTSHSANASKRYRTRNAAIYSPASSTDRATIADSNDDVEENNSTHNHFIIGLDYGTTYSSVSWMELKPNEPNEKAPAVHAISDYPNDFLNHGQSTQVPTETWYHRLSADHSKSTTPDSNPREAANGIQDSDGNILELLRKRSKPQTTISKEVFWGYHVQHAVNQARVNIADKESCCIKRAKLLLDSSERTRQERQKLRSAIRRLKNAGLIQAEEDIFIDFLTPLLQHTKTQLKKWSNYNDNSEVEFILTFPPTWSDESKTIMDNALSEAIDKAQFRKASSGPLLNLHNFFHVSEPEAAAIYVTERADWSHTLTVIVP